LWVPDLNRLTRNGIFLIYYLNFWLLMVIINLFVGFSGLFCLFTMMGWRWQFSIRTFLIISSISGLPFLAATWFYWWCLTLRFSCSLGGPHRWLSLPPGGCGLKIGLVKKVEVKTGEFWPVIHWFELSLGMVKPAISIHLISQELWLMVQFMPIQVQFSCQLFPGSFNWNFKG